MRRFSRPEVPSIVRGHSRACVNRCRSRVRSRDGFRYDPALGALSLTAPRSPLFGVDRWLRWARPPSTRIATFREFPRGTPTCASLGQAAAQRLLQLHPDARTHPRVSDSRLLRGAALRNRLEYALANRRPFLGSCDLPLSKKDYESREPRQSFRRRPYDAASAPQNTTPKATDQSRRRLRATPRPDHRLRRWPLDDSAELHGPSGSE